MSKLDGIQTLIVDDHRQMRLLGRSVLRAAGLVRVAEAGDANEALELLNRFHVDLVLVDWQMRPIDGITLTKEIRSGRRVRDPEIAIVMMTAYTDLTRVKAARDAGVNGLVRKPMSAQQLLDRVSAALSDTRAFIRGETYIGPDRRRITSRDYAGPFRRAADRIADLVLDDESGVRQAS